MKTGEEWLRSRVRAWGECYEPGTRFISNFHRLYLDGAHSSGFVATCLSMQEDLDYCRSLQIAHSNKGLSNTELVDNFSQQVGCLTRTMGSTIKEKSMPMLCSVRNCCNITCQFVLQQNRFCQRK